MATLWSPDVLPPLRRKDRFGRLEMPGEILYVISTCPHDAFSRKLIDCDRVLTPNHNEH